MHRLAHQLNPDGIAYWRAGDHGSTVLLIMGFGMSGQAWEQQFFELSKHHRVVCFDHLGLGKSSSIRNQTITMSSMADHALSILDYLNWDSAHIVGVSMGGMIAQHLALKSKHRVKSVTFIATTAGGILSLLPPVKGIIGFCKVNMAKKPEERLLSLLKLLFPDDFSPEVTNESYNKMLDIYGYDAPKSTRIAHLKAILKHSTTKQLKSLATENVMIISPGLDILIHPDQSKKLQRLIPNSRLVMFESAGHGVMNQCAIELNKELLTFFASSDKQL